MGDNESEEQPLIANSQTTPNMGNRENHLGRQTAMLDPSEVPISSSVSSGSRTPPPNYSYEELSSGFTCPTCHGKGKIPRGTEADLVALIPYNDARLKPRKEYLYVIVSVLICAAVAGILCAFLIPRPLSMAVNAVRTVWVKSTNTTVELLIEHEFSVSNKNFVSAYGQNATITAFWSEEVKGSNISAIPVTVPGRGSHQFSANVTAIFTESFLVSYCTNPSPTHIIYMQFIATLQFTLMSQNQQISKTYYSPVKCADIDYSF